MAAAGAALSAARTVTDAVDGSGLSKVADDAGIEAGTNKATAAYSTEEAGVGQLSLTPSRGKERNADVGSQIGGEERPT